ncbi:MAG: SusC/RagA family TonB-linked outer membrane protein, partial [Bacteroidales bacterium]|nr:SusC/RagA family TonB-linked outer membrane protein [Bacteroidales bacterium]
IDVTLSEGATEIEEVMVVAYGTTTKASFTGSASVVKSDQIAKISGVSAVESLQGMSAGVNITNNEGNPGSTTRVQIRGIANMTGKTTPLYVVDGMPYDGSILSIAPSDIESMTVLKDAAASSLYGSRAANGVVVITTKQGKSGRPVVTLRTAWGTSDNAVKNPTKADPYQQLLNTWRGIYNDEHYRNGLSEAAAGDIASASVVGVTNVPRINSQGQTVFVTPFANMPADQYVLHDGSGNPYTNPALQMVWDESDYDWYGAVFSRKLRQDYNIDVSGASGDGKTNYFLSASHLNDKGYANNQYYKRYSFRANVTSEINSWLSMGGALSYSYSRKNVAGAHRALVFSNTLNSPWLRNADNTDWEYSLKTGKRMYDYGQNSKHFFGIHVLNNGGDYWNNPNDESFGNDEGGMLNAKYFLGFNLPFDIKFKSSISLGDYSNARYGYGSAIHGGEQQEPYGVTVTTNGGDASRTNTRTMSLTWNNILSWDKTFNDHTFSVLAGQEFYSRDLKEAYTYGAGIMQAGLYEVSSTTNNWSGSSYRDRYGLLSFFGKLDYNFQNKYYLSASIRGDGSSRFHPDQRWGTFYSAGASWRISQENFLSDVDFLNNLALRASYGTTGNDDIGTYYAYQGYYGSHNMYGQAGFRPISVATPDLQWERNEQFNVGLDFGLFNRINGSVEYYTRNSNGLLYNKDLPVSAQVGEATSMRTNLGDITNRGVEISINADAIRNQDFQWNINANFTTLHNEVTYLPGGAYSYQSWQAWYRIEEGHSLYSFYSPRYAGVDPANGNLLFYVKDGNNGWKTTDKWSDVTQDDFVWSGSALPTAFGSITNSFAYKGLDLSFMWYASLGSTMFDYGYYERTTLRDGIGLIPDLVEGKVWQKPGDNAYFPAWSKADFGITRRPTDMYLFNTSFLRLRNVTLGYTLPENFIKRLGISRLRVYITGDNLLTFSETTKNYTDPETGINGNNYNGNADTDSGIQGARRVYMCGLQVSF